MTDFYSSHMLLRHVLDLTSPKHVAQLLRRAACLQKISPGHIWTTLYIYRLYLIEYCSLFGKFVLWNLRLSQWWLWRVISCVMQFHTFWYKFIHFSGEMTARIFKVDPVLWFNLILVHHFCSYNSHSVSSNSREVKSCVKVRTEHVNESYHENDSIHACLC